VLAPTGWELILAIPTDDLLREPQQKATLFLGLGAVTCALLFWRLRRTAEQVSIPLAELAESSDALIRGEAITVPETRIYEVLQAARAFETASRALVEKRALEDQLRHAQRLEMLGTMAGGIAHDVNNQLFAIMGQLDQAREALPESGDHRTHLDKAEEATLACSQITKALLTFSRPTKPAARAVDVNELVRSTAGLLEHVRQRNVRIVLDLSDGRPEILGEPVQLQQVLMNLGVNAKDAMPDGGTLTVATGSGAGRAWIRVTDTGMGMSPEIREKIFTPFFTTKGDGKGTGLGLAMVFGIVKAHGGEVEVLSAVGEGTTFALSFPASIRV
jgi:signal transduction histidine kinase